VRVADKEEEHTGQAADARAEHQPKLSVPPVVCKSSEGDECETLGDDAEGEDAGRERERVNLAEEMHALLGSRETGEGTSIPVRHALSYDTRLAGEAPVHARRLGAFYLTHRNGL